MEESVVKSSSIDDCHISYVGKSNNIKCVYFNARSIVNKRSELELLIRGENVDIVGISETWLFNDISDNEISFNAIVYLDVTVTI